MATSSLNTISIGESSAASPIVMLHGWGQSAQALFPFGELLSEYRKVVLIDLPGFGKSVAPQGATNEGGGWDTDQYATAVKEQLDALGISRCVLLGHSFGGRISVRLAARYPALIEKLVLVATHGIPRTKSLREQLHSAVIKVGSRIVKLIDAAFGSNFFATRLAPKIGSRDYLAAGDLRKTLVKTVNEDLSSIAGTIAAPTLLLWGDSDTETPLDIGLKYKAHIKNSELHVLRGKGHEPYKDVGAHLLSFHIARFLNAIGGGR